MSFPLDQTFFGLTLEYRHNLIQQIYYLVKHLRFNYSDVLNMPVYERKIYIDMWQKEMEKEQKQYNKSKSGKR